MIICHNCIAHNPSNRIGEVDVHGLRVEEAITETEKAVQQVHKSGLRRLKVITGWRKHSNPQSTPVLRSRILERLSVE
jgi:DNA-nicking Smr family endonuclease